MELRELIERLAVSSTVIYADRRGSHVRHRKQRLSCSRFVNPAAGLWVKGKRRMLIISALCQMSVRVFLQSHACSSPNPSTSKTLLSPFSETVANIAPSSLAATATIALRDVR